AAGSVSASRLSERDPVARRLGDPRTPGAVGHRDSARAAGRAERRLRRRRSVAFDTRAPDVGCRRTACAIGPEIQRLRITTDGWMALGAARVQRAEIRRAGERHAWRGPRREPEVEAACAACAIGFEVQRQSVDAQLRAAVARRRVYARERLWRSERAGARG